MWKRVDTNAAISNKSISSLGNIPARHVAIANYCIKTSSPIPLKDLYVGRQISLKLTKHIFTAWLTIVAIDGEHIYCKSKTTGKYCLPRGCYLVSRECIWDGYKTIRKGRVKTARDNLRVPHKKQKKPKHVKTSKRLLPSQIRKFSDFRHQYSGSVVDAKTESPVVESRRPPTTPIVSCMVLFDNKLSDKRDELYPE